MEDEEVEEEEGGNDSERIRCVLSFSTDVICFPTAEGLS